MNSPANVPSTTSLHILRDAARICRACDLFRNATQTVFGEGPRNARIVAIGEQPGDYEDKQGHPFVGPAGKILTKALQEAGIQPEEVYITNAVKHFKFEQRGKRRIHKKPNDSEIRACRPWLAAEMAAIKPEVILCMGVTAAQSIFAKKIGINANRGKVLVHPWASSVFVTVHPSAILRSITSEDRHREYASFVQDLRAVDAWLRHASAA